MKKMTKYQETLIQIINELNKIKFHIENEKPFETGVALGSLINFLYNKFDQSEKHEEDEEVQDEESDEECEEGSEEKKCEMQDELDNMKKQYIINQNRIIKLEEFIKLLLKNDLIHKTSIDSTLNIIKKENQTMDDMYQLYLWGSL